MSLLVWVKPPWARQIEDGRHEFSIGDYCGFIRCNSNLEYFLSEGSYRPQEDLNNQKLLHLNVVTLNESVDGASVLEDFGAENGLTFVLDVDLDFLSTHNPFLGCLAKGDIYADLKKIFHFDLSAAISSTNSEEILKASTARLQQLDTLEEFFHHLSEKNNLDDFEAPEALMDVWEDLLRLVEKVKKLYIGDELNWMLINDAGCTIDSSGLPHHESSLEEIDDLINKFKNFLQELPRPPVLVTISRSSEDDYCPAEQVELVQKRVLQTLEEVYGDKLTTKPIRRYKDEEWHI